MCFCLANCAILKTACFYSFIFRNVISSGLQSGLSLKIQSVCSINNYVVPKDAIKELNDSEYSEQYEKDPLFNNAVNRILYSPGAWGDYFTFIEAISELCQCKCDETQFRVDMEFVEGLLSGFLKRK